MFVQLDAAQVISLIDDCALGQELRPLLAGHVCVVPSSVLIDLRKKNDAPLINYRRALRGLHTVWALDAGMICRDELNAHERAFMRGDRSQSQLAVAEVFWFREAPMEALAVRAGVEVPEPFRDKTFGDLFGADDARAVFDFLATTVGADYLQKFAKVLEAGLASQPASLPSPISATASLWGMTPLAAAIALAEPGVVVKHFPANALMCQIWKTARADRKRSWSDNDIADVFQVASAPYCDVAFMDAKAAGRTRRAASALGMQVEIVANADVVNFLRSRC